MTNDLTYGQRCELAATAQHLDPVCDELDRVGGIEYDVHNLGGYCMGVVARFGARVVVVTTWDNPAGTATVGLYEVDQWEDGGEFERMRDDVLLVDVPEVVVEFGGAL